MNDQPLNFCAFVMDTPSHMIHGLWRDPEGEQVRFNDPMVIISALAAATENLGLAFTFGVGQEPPFQFARQVSTLDHATKGRLAWNIALRADRESGLHADPSKT